VLGGRPRARILLEACTESEWVARHLESLGHEVIVADPNCAPLCFLRNTCICVLDTDVSDSRGSDSSMRTRTFSQRRRGLLVCDTRPVRVANDLPLAVLRYGSMCVNFYTWRPTLLSMNGC
jgi:hypothetical protein